MCVAGGRVRGSLPCPLQPETAQRNLAVLNVRLWETESGLGSRTLCCMTGEHPHSPGMIMALDAAAGWQQNLGFSPCSVSSHFSVGMNKSQPWNDQKAEFEAECFGGPCGCHPDNILQHKRNERYFSHLKVLWKHIGAQNIHSSLSM